MQYDLFDSLSSTLIPLPLHTALPQVLTDNRHGVQLGSHFVPYQLQRTKRRSIGFLITHQGLVIRAPRWVNLAAINQAIVSKQGWILRKLQEQQHRSALAIETPAVWSSGTQLPYLGQLATLCMQPSAASYFDSATNSITLNLPTNATPAECKKQLLTWLTQQAQQQFSQRLLHFAQQLGTHYHSFALSNARTSWGSCNAQGKIRLNWRLIHCSPHLIDYVVAHELAHLRELNHSPRFWAIVERIFPDYVAARNELKRVDLAALPRF